MTGRIIALLLLFFPAIAMAQEMQPRPKCEAVVPPPAALSGWTSKMALSSVIDGADIAAATLAPGKAATVALHPTRQVHYITQPEKPGGSVAHGGLVGIAIASAGTYQVNLNSGAWIDVLKDGKAVESTAHAPGPACTGIGKTVQFPLQPGRYILQISANADPDIAVMVSLVR
jgi:hypothetical protein